jgi:hypothetical protein
MNGSPVITLCDCVDEVCQVLPRADQIIHHPFQNPAESGDDDDILAGFRRLTDQIRDWTEVEFAERNE